MRIPAILFMVMAFLFISSCKKDDPIIYTAEDLYGKWEATSFVSNESVSYSKNNNYNPKINFFDSGVYGIDLDYNFCGGNYIIPDQNNIQFDSPVCTKLWTDSEFSIKFSEMVFEVSTFTFEQNGDLQLNIDEWGYILLQKVD